MFYGQDASGRHSRKNAMVAPVQYIDISENGLKRVSLLPCGKLVLLNMTKWRVSPGAGKVSMEHSPKRRWRKSLLGRIQQTGEKKGTKRHLLVEGHGVPLSIVVTGANRHDVTQVGAVLDDIVVERPEVTEETPQHLCGDKGYTGEPARQEIESRGYTPHIMSRGQERVEKQTIPGYRARRWVVEVAHSWLNRFRKILVRFEKTDLSYEGLLHLGCAMIAWRKTCLIYG